MNYLIQDTTLVGIADAVRGKGGTSDPIAVKDLATAITNLPSGGGSGEEIEPIVLSGTLSYGCAGAVSSAFCKMFPDKVSTKDIEQANNMFFNYANESIPFDLNFKANKAMNMNYMFAHSNNLKTLPKFNNCKPDSMNDFFNNCWHLREIPEDFGNDWDWSGIDNQTSGYAGSRSNLFNTCKSLRKVPKAFLNHGNPVANYSYSIYSSMCYECTVLDELVDIPFPHTATWTSNAFTSTVSMCTRLKRFTFATAEDGSPVVMNWKKQTLDLATSVGFGGSVNAITGYNTGITEDKWVRDDETYQALKNDPDWFTNQSDYSRYNHDSAVETINSLPDTTISGGTNTIKFKGAAGARTDGGAINTLTEEEIAVATAKGWTVTLT